MSDPNPPPPNTVVKDTNQLLFHIAWPGPGVGNVATIADGMKERLKDTDNAKKYIIFNRFVQGSAKEHERNRRAGEGSTDFNITYNTQLPRRDSIIKNTGNKRGLFNLLCTFKLDEDTTMVGKDESIVRHDEADITLISYMLDAAKR